MKKRGRPAGSGKRWSESTQAQLWARFKFVMRRDKHRDVKRAARTIAADGYWQWNAGRAWLSRPFKESETRSLLARMSRSSRIMDKRTENPAEVFRTQFYAAARRRRANLNFRASCDYFLGALDS